MSNHIPTTNIKSRPSVRRFGHKSNGPRFVTHSSNECCSAHFFLFLLLLLEIHRECVILLVKNMQNIHRIISRLSSSSPTFLKPKTNGIGGAHQVIISSRVFSTESGGNNEPKDEWKSAVGGSFGGSGSASGDLGWDSVYSWSTGLTKDHFDGEVVGHRTTTSSTTNEPSPSSLISAAVADLQEIDDKMREMEAENKKSKSFVDGWGERMREMTVMLKQVKEPGARGSYLKDSEKTEMYKLHKQNPEIYTVEKLAKDYRIMRQRVHAILWLKELEEEEEKKLGHPLEELVG